jgi:hypothetical protein
MLLDASQGEGTLTTNTTTNTSSSRRGNNNNNNNNSNKKNNNEICHRCDKLILMETEKRRKLKREIQKKKTERINYMTLRNGNENIINQRTTFSKMVKDYSSLCGSRTRFLPEHL